MAIYAYQDPTGKKLTQGAYERQKQAGNDVSMFKPISTSVSNTDVSIDTKSPKNSMGEIINPTDADVANFNKQFTTDIPNVLQVGNISLSKDSEAYKTLTKKGMTDQDIINQYTKIKEGKATSMIEPKKVETPKEVIQPDIVPPEKTEFQKQQEKAQLDYQDTSMERLSQIEKNLATAYATNPQGFANYDEFKRAYNYDKRAVEQQQKLDSFWKNKEFQEKFLSLTPQEIGDMSISGIYSQSDLSTLQSKDPEKYKAVQDYVTKKKATDSANNDIAGKTQEEIIASKLGIDTPEQIDLVAKYDELMGTDELKNLSSSLITKKSEIDTIDQNIANMRKDIEAQFAGTGMASGVIDAIIADRTDSLNRDKTAKAIAYNAELNQYSNLKSIAEGKYNAIKDQNTQKQKDFENSLSIVKLYNDIIGTNEASKTVTNPITGQIFQRNPNTNTYDIEVGGASGNQVESSRPTESSTGYIDVPRNVNGYTNNIGVDTNNVGNITKPTSSSIGLYKSPNGRTYAVYANVQDGYNALVNDLKSKQSGKTSTGLNSNSTIEQLLGVWVNGKGEINNGNYYKSFLSASGLNPGTKIGSVDVNKLARGIMGGEGTLKMYEKGGVDLSSYISKPSSTSNIKIYKDELIPLYNKYNSPNSSMPDNKQLYQMYGISDPKVAQQKFLSEALSYKNRTPSYSEEKTDVYNSLSPEAKSVVDGKRKLDSTIDIKTRTAITNELSEKGWYNLGLGNEDFFKIKAEDKGKFADLINMQDMINTMSLLDPSVSTNSVKAIKNSLAETFSFLGVKQPSDDYLSLRTVSGKALTEYIKRISGVAVSEQEYQRLSKYIPNVTMSDKTFKNTLNQFIREYNNIINEKLTTYGFDDVSSFRTALLGSNNPVFNYGVVGNNDIYNYGDNVLSGANDLINKNY